MSSARPSFPRTARENSTSSGTSADPLDRQTRLGDLWLPQRGIFFVGESYLDPFDASRHWSPTPVARSTELVLTL
jgi:hypothetical protein